ncbi:MAG: tRNA uridine-5-carboxymethylaminomethyl(34) synthesis enzyme MnmG, partial [Clostridia bacterium]|nr:tRNA uridine-5-carboxymethylaminomethyl(34) synthesis enzyme MnmG [Clostridia bacterium]
RQDNADERLTPIGYKVGLISEERYEKFKNKLDMIDKELARLGEIVLSPKVINPILEKKGTTPVSTGLRMTDALRRPELIYEDLAEVDPKRPELPVSVCEEVEIKIKYDGYIKRQKQQAEQFKKLEGRLLPTDIDYNAIYGLRIEARQKLEKIRPASLGQASRISGVSPSDISVLIIWLEANDG